MIHPLNSEVIGYVIQRTESMMAVCYLLTLYAAARVMSSGSGSWAITAVVASAAGMACKESMVTAPVMVLLYDAVFHAGSIRGALRQRRWFYAGLAGTWIVLGFLIASGPRWRSAGFQSGISPWTYLLNQPAMILTYLRLAVWPDPLVLDYGITHPIALRDALGPSLAVVALLVVSTLAWRKSRPLGYALTWFWITLAPTSSVMPIATEVGAERRMYLPLMALVVVGVVAAQQLSARMEASLPRRSPRLYTWAKAGVLLLVGLTSVALNHRRLREYGSEIGLWEAVLSRRPQDRAHYNLGIALAEAGRNEEAIPHYRQSVGNEPRAHYALGLELERSGKYDEAFRQYEAFLRRKPDDYQAPQAHARLGIVLAHFGQNDAAIGELEQAIRMRPTLTDAVGALADVMLSQERFAEAEYGYRRYIAAAPTDAHAHRNLGLSLVHQGRVAEAIPILERAVQLDPGDGAVRLYLGNAFMAVKRPDAAEEHYRAGWRLVPESPTLPKALAGAMVLSNRPSEALAVLEEARRRHSDDEEIEAAYADLKRGLTRSNR